MFMIIPACCSSAGGASPPSSSTVAAAVLGVLFVFVLSTTLMSLLTGIMTNSLERVISRMERLRCVQ